MNFILATRREDGNKVYLKLSTVVEARAIVDELNSDVEVTTENGTKYYVDYLPSKSDLWDYIFEAIPVDKST